MQFPCFMYRHDAPEGRIFNGAAEFDEAGAGWVDSPAKLNGAEPAEQPVEPDAAPVKRGPGRPRKVQ